MKKTTHDKLETLWGAIFMILFFFVIPIVAPALIDWMFTAIGL